MENITYLEYKHAKRVWEDFGIQHLGEYYGSYIQSDTLLIMNVFGSFLSKCSERFKLDPAYFLSAPE